jgi:hypothetical protein
MGKKIQHKNGEVFNYLTFIKEIEPIISSNKKVRVGNFICKCGNIRNIMLKSVRLGITKSCGCYHIEQSKIRKTQLTHNQAGKKTRTVEYTAWAAMKDRCYNPKNIRWNCYGGRGIKVCDRWINSFEYFFEDMGVKPSRIYSMDRIDVNGNYEPSNCKWSTSKEQANNRRKNS